MHDAAVGQTLKAKRAIWSSIPVEVEGRIGCNACEPGAEQSAARLTSQLRLRSDLVHFPDHVAKASGSECMLRGLPSPEIMSNPSE